MGATANSRAKVAATTFGLFCLSLFLTAYSSRNHGVAGVGGGLIAEVQRPFQYLNRMLGNGVGGLWGRYVALINVNEENEALNERLKALEAQNSRLLEFKAENERLKSLLKMMDETGMKDAVAATVIGYDPSNWVQAVVVDKGSRQGVGVGMAVVQGEGVVGQVVAVSPSTARVLLVTDHSSGVDAIVQGSRARGIVIGDGNGMAVLEYVLRDEILNLGTRIITSGMDDVYPKGLLLGKVYGRDPRKNGLFESIEIKPAVDFSKLENVAIVTTIPLQRRAGGSFDIEAASAPKPSTDIGSTGDDADGADNDDADSPAEGGQAAKEAESAGARPTPKAAAIAGTPEATPKAKSTPKAGAKPAPKATPKPHAEAKPTPAPKPPSASGSTSN